jgi:hypothetical protein
MKTASPGVAALVPRVVSVHTMPRPLTLAFESCASSHRDLSRKALPCLLTMTTRIGLFTHREKKKKGLPSTDATYVDVATAAELAAKIIALGGKRVGLMRRERDGTTKLEGEMFEPAKINAVHLEWLSAKPEEFQTRGVFYD